MKFCLNFFTFILIFLLSAAAAFAQNQEQKPWWYTLEQGKLQFRNGDYGNALLTFEDARRQRRDLYERMEADYIALLSIGEVRRLGDSLDWVERYARERHYAGALLALEELYYRVPRESFNNSAEAALSSLGRLKNYPEAEYWIGEVCRVEGELALALDQYRKAWELRDLFENPDFGTELLYKIAAIRKTRREYNEMERVLLSIVAEDSLWTNAGKGDAAGEGQTLPYAEASASFARQAMTRTLEGGSDAPRPGAPAPVPVNRFLSMYRYSNTRAEEAHRRLGLYYYASGRHGRAQEHLMFAFLIQNTVIIEEIIRRQYDFTFTTLEALAAEINRDSLLAAYAAQTDYYQTAYCLATSLHGNGKTAAARGIWSFLASRPEAGEWRNRALGQLSRPHTERVVEMP